MSTYYLDDSLLIGSNFFDCFNNVKATEQILIDAGFIINYQKSVLMPTSEKEYLGFVINSITITITLPKHKKLKILELCTNYSRPGKFVIIIIII